MRLHRMSNKSVPILRGSKRLTRVEYQTKRMNETNVEKAHAAKKQRSLEKMSVLKLLGSMTVRWWWDQ